MADIVFEFQINTVTKMHPSLWSAIKSGHPELTTRSFFGELKAHLSYSAGLLFPADRTESDKPF